MGIKIIFAKKHKDDESGVLAIQHIEHGNKTQKRIGISIKQTDFHDHFNKQLNGFTSKDFLHLNTKINKEIYSFLNKKNLSSNDEKDEIVKIENNENRNNYVSYIKFFNEELEKIIVPNTKSKHKDVLKSIKKFINHNNKKDLLFMEINLDWIELFVVYLKNNGLANSSIVDYISIFRRVLNKAIDREIFYFKKNPFVGYESLKKNTNLKEPLSDENIIKLINLKSDGTSNIDRLIYIKNMFLFQFFSNGMRMSDLFFIRWGDFTKEKLVYKMMKTDKNMEVYFNINICHILNEILETNLNYEEIILRVKIDLPINTYRALNEFSGVIKRVNIIECNELLEKLHVRKENISNNIKGGDIGRYENYKGYYYQHSFPLHTREAIKEVIDLRFDIEERIEKFYIEKTFVLIRSKNINKEFVFEKFIKDKQRKIFEKYDKNKEFNETQYIRFKNLQGRYNYYLKRIEEVFEFDIHLSSHIARHSFINSLLKSGKADLWDIMNLMGHGELRTSEKYINKHFQGKEKEYKLNKEITRNYQMRKIE